MSYAHLIQHERYQIQSWHAAGVYLREIANRLQAGDVRWQASGHSQGARRGVCGRAGARRARRLFAISGARNRGA